MSEDPVEQLKRWAAKHLPPGRLTLAEAEQRAATAPVIVEAGSLSVDETVAALTAAMRAGTLPAPGWLVVPDDGETEQ